MSDGTPGDLHETIKAHLEATDEEVSAQGEHLTDLDRAFQKMINQVGAIDKRTQGIEALVRRIAEQLGLEVV